jgi:hypothetical protein
LSSFVVGDECEVAGEMELDERPKSNAGSGLKT